MNSSILYSVCLYLSILISLEVLLKIYSGCFKTGQHQPNTSFLKFPNYYSECFSENWQFIQNFCLDTITWCTITILAKSAEVKFLSQYYLLNMSFQVLFLRFCEFLPAETLKKPKPFPEERENLTWACIHREMVHGKLANQSARFIVALL